MKKTGCYTTIEITALAEIGSALDCLVNDVNARVRSLQEMSGKFYDEIRIELWIDSGRIIAFPANAELADRIDVAGCQICCKELALAVNELDESSCSDRDYDSRFSVMQAHIADLTRDKIKGKFPSFSIRDPDGLPI